MTRAGLREQSREEEAGLGRYPRAARGRGPLGRACIPDAAPTEASE